MAVSTAGCTTVTLPMLEKVVFVLPCSQTTRTPGGGGPWQDWSWLAQATHKTSKKLWYQGEWSPPRAEPGINTYLFFSIVQICAPSKKHLLLLHQSIRVPVSFSWNCWWGALTMEPGTAWKAVRSRPTNPSVTLSSERPFDLLLHWFNLSWHIRKYYPSLADWSRTCESHETRQGLLPRGLWSRLLFRWPVLH